MSHEHKKYSKTMMKNKEVELQKNFEVEYIEDCQEGFIVDESAIYKDYDILMHKVDVGFGHWVCIISTKFKLIVSS